MTAQTLSEVFLHLIEHKVDFGVYHDGNSVTIGYDPADEEIMLSKWSDGGLVLGKRRAR
jgi:hypothetical protein